VPFRKKYFPTCSQPALTPGQRCKHIVIRYKWDSESVGHCNYWQETVDLSVIKPK
jgi:hypothetical protein